MERDCKNRIERITQTERLINSLVKWQSIVVEDGEVEKSPLFLNSGSLTPAFAQWVDQNKIIHSGLNKNTSSILLFGPISQEEFREKLTQFEPNWETYGINFIYEREEEGPTPQLSGILLLSHR
jgi:hypothetical protein